MKVEVIVTTFREAMEAERLGANRIELIANYEAGGITPSFGTIRNVMEHVSIPVHVMIRPHARSFVYDEEDVETMLADIGLCRELGVTGIVFGALTSQGTIDERLLGEVIKHKGDLALTFHRAFDASRDIEQALDVLNEYPEVDSILTSGGADSAVEGLDRLVRLTERAIPTILPGAGIRPENVGQVRRALQCDWIHVGSGVRQNSKLEASLFESIRKNGGAETVE